MSGEKTSSGYSTASELFSSVLVEQGEAQGAKINDPKP